MPAPRNVVGRAYVVTVPALGDVGEHDRAVRCGLEVVDEVEDGLVLDGDGCAAYVFVKFVYE